jgi:hypothetical protein
MNIESIMSMEQFSHKVATMTPERQDEFFKKLEGTCLTEEDINTLKGCVTLYKIFTDNRFRKQAQEALCEAYLTELEKE